MEAAQDVEVGPAMDAAVAAVMGAEPRITYSVWDLDRNQRIAGRDPDRGAVEYWAEAFTGQGRKCEIREEREYSVYSTTDVGMGLVRDWLIAQGWKRIIFCYDDGLPGGHWSCSMYNDEWVVADGGATMAEAVCRALLAAHWKKAEGE